MERALLRARRAGARSAQTEQDRPWSLPSRLGGSTGLRRGVPSARVGGRLKGERPSPSPGGETGGTTTRSTRVASAAHRAVALIPRQRGGTGRPGTQRAHAALPTRRGALPLGSRPAPPLGLWRLRLPTCSALSAAPPARRRSPGASGGRAWPSERSFPLSPRPHTLLPAAWAGPAGSWREEPGVG